MAIRRWEDPFLELRQTIDRVIEESFRPLRMLRGYEEVVPFPVDVYQTEDEVIVKASLPGVNPEDVDVSITGDVLTIKGEMKEEKEIKEEDFLLKEMRRGTFSRSINLPPNLEPEKAEAEFEKGILTVKIPRKEKEKPKTIKVKAKKVVE